MIPATDYSRIYERYDANPDRHRIAVDAALGTLLDRRGAGTPVRVLDLACGTGNWLDVQGRACAGRPVAWHGLDASADMLGVARAKVPAARFVEGRAERLPYAAGTFDFVAVNFAFHHFADKDAALDEIARVLAPDGLLRMNNLAAERAAGWWVYRYFPAAAAVDRERFWTVDRIVAALAARGFACEVGHALDNDPVPFAVKLEEARRRDISELHLITEEQYRAGLAAMERACAADPGAALAPGLPLYSLLAHRR
jgi:ubiquinone/menaquinone biosynthesis C-methylase UbiE